MEDVYSQNKLLKHLDRLDSWEKTGFVYPILVDFELTNKCNNRCPLCTGPRDKDVTTMDIEKAKRVIVQLKEIGVKAITLGGIKGDPSCHPNLEEIIRYIKQNNMEVSLVTNGYQLPEKVINAVVDCCTWVRVSLDASNPEAYKKTHGMNEEAFYQVIENLKKLVSRKKELNQDITIGVSYLIGPPTINGIYDATEIAKNIGVNYIRFRPFFMWESKKELAVKKYETMMEDINRAQKLNEENFIVSYAEDRCTTVQTEKKRPYNECYAHNFVTSISPDLKVYPCCILKNNPKYLFGDLNEKTFKEIWESERRKAVIKSINFSDCPYPCMLEKHNEFLWNLKKNIPHSNFL